MTVVTQCRVRCWCRVEPAFGGATDAAAAAFDESQPRTLLSPVSPALHVRLLQQHLQHVHICHRQQQDSLTSSKRQQEVLSLAVVAVAERRPPVHLLRCLPAYPPPPPLAPRTYRSVAATPQSVTAARPRQLQLDCTLYRTACRTQPTRDACRPLNASRNSCHSADVRTVWYGAVQGSTVRCAPKLSRAATSLASWPQAASRAEACHAHHRYRTSPPPAPQPPASAPP